MLGVGLVAVALSDSIVHVFCLTFAYFLVDAQADTSAPKMDRADSRNPDARSGQG